MTHINQYDSILMGDIHNLKKITNGLLTSLGFTFHKEIHEWVKLIKIENELAGYMVYDYDKVYSVKPDNNEILYGVEVEYTLDTIKQIIAC